MGGSNSKKELATQVVPKIPVKKFLTLGLSGVGKTSLIYKLRHGELPEGIMATIGIDFQILYQDGLKLQAWDYTGRERYRTVVQSYYRGASGIIYMIDSADASTLDESLNFLSTVFEQEHPSHMTVMVVANKQDLDDAVGPEVIEEKIKERSFKIGPGISVFVMPMSVIAEDDHSMQLAFRLFVKTMKRKDVGKVQSGLIPHAWETAEKEAEDSEVELDNDDDADREDNLETKVMDNNDVKETKEKDGCLPFIVGGNGKKKSIFKDPVHAFKSLLIH